MSRSDLALVLGAGHNGLAAAIRLARAGRKVVVLERRESAGGLAAVEEFAPGYRVPGIVHDTLGLRRRVIDELNLAGYGLTLRDRPALMLLPEALGRGLILRPGDDAMPDGLPERSATDAANWKTWRQELEPIRAVLASLIDESPPVLQGAGWSTLFQLARPGIAFRRLGAEVIGRILRATPMSVEDLLHDHFSDELLRAGLATRGIEGGFLGPRSAGSSALLLMRELAGGPGVVGGPEALTDALLDAARDAGVELVFGQHVSKLLIEDLGVRGAETSDGKLYEADLVLSGFGVKQTIAACQGVLPVRVRSAAKNVLARGTTAAIRLALSRPLRFREHEESNFEYARLVRSTVQLERAFDHMKYAEPSTEPWLDIAVPSIARPEYAPAGHASVSILVHSAAHNLKGGWTESARGDLLETTLCELETVAIELRSSIVASEVLTPIDLEERFGLDGGHPQHAELGLNQLWIQRPSIHLSRYKTGIAGLFLAGRATHPGGEFLGSSGLLAAEAALRPA